ncbi:murein transglycosylase domain-containing protein [Halarcobacter sp.]|uniref:murein transglycosylase domain-containing protein n=1 Tax=Halarcobacter sp. TaxID=2321133 RepID=UPI002AA603DA|nr:murein transglycosylase domain-containing protein [Halarcobacter sp.]
MKFKLIIFSTLFLFTGCTVNDVYSISRAAISKDPSLALKSLAKSKAISYAQNPNKLSKDLSFLSSFVNKITESWGKDNVKIPKQKEYVKYLQNYKSRALIDFDNGLVTVETLDTKESLKNAIVTTLLLPDDPRAADLFGAKKIKLGDTPYLLGEVKDDQNKDIRYQWRANRYADILIKSRLKEKNIKDGNKNLKVTYVTIPMIKDHASVRVKKFKPFVEKFARRYNLSKNLVYAIIKTESNFNQFAVSSAGAFGLMQIVPSSAGQDAYKYVKGKNHKPSSSYLFNAQNNIELGSAYIDILNSKYLKGINNKISKEYCVISAYNTGSGNVLKTFSKNRNSAINIINKKSALEVYNTLKNNLPYKETRRYLNKVITYKKEFVNI